MVRSRDIRAVLESDGGDAVLTGPFHGELHGQQWMELDAEDATFTEVDFSECDLTGSRFQDCAFTGCRLNGTGMADARLRDVTLNTTSLAGMQLPRARLDGVRFDTCDLSGVVLLDSELTDVMFVRSKLSFANFSVSAWWDVVVDRCPAIEAAFDGARFRDVRITASPLDASTFHKATVHPGTRLDIRGCSIDGVAGLLRVGSMLVDEGQALSIAAALLAEHDVEVSNEAPPDPLT